MKCPSCKDIDMEQDSTDPGLYGCPECFTVHSMAWLMGFWVGYYESKDGENAEIRIDKSVTLDNL